jgi:hypothetical protein
MEFLRAVCERAAAAPPVVACNSKMKTNSSKRMREAGKTHEDGMARYIAKGFFRYTSAGEVRNSSMLLSRASLLFMLATVLNKRKEMRLNPHMHQCTIVHLSVPLTERNGERTLYMH